MYFAESIKITSLLHYLSMRLSCERRFKLTFQVCIEQRLLLLMSLLFCLGIVAESYGFGGIDITSALNGGAEFSGMDNQLLMKGGRPGKTSIVQLDAAEVIRNTIDPPLKALIDSINPEEFEPVGTHWADPDKDFERVLRASPCQPEDFAGSKSCWIVTSGAESFICQTGQITDSSQGQFVWVDKAIEDWNKEIQPGKHHFAAYLPDLSVITDPILVAMTGLIRRVHGNGGSAGTGGTTTENTGGSSTASSRSLVVCSSTASGNGMAGAGGGDDPGDDRNWMQIKVHKDGFYIDPDDDNKALMIVLAAASSQYVLGRISTYSLLALAYYWPVSWIPGPVYRSLRNYPRISSFCMGVLCSAGMYFWQTRSGHPPSAFFIQGAVASVPYFGRLYSDLLPRGYQSICFAYTLGLMMGFIMEYHIAEHESNLDQLPPWRFFLFDWFFRGRVQIRQIFIRRR